MVDLRDNAQGKAEARTGYVGVDPAAAAAAVAGFADVTLVVDRECSVLFAAALPGSTFLELTGLSAGADLRESLTRESLGKFQDLMEDADAGALGRTRQLNHKTIAGGSLAFRYQAIRQGRSGDVLLVGRDLSALSDMQQRLVKAQQATERDYGRIRAMETRYRVLFQLSSEPMMICDAASRKVSEANAACLAAFGLPLSRIVGRSPSSLFDEHDGDVLAGLVTNAMSGGDSRAATLRAAGGEMRFATSINLFRQDGASHFLVRPSPVAEPGPLAANDATVLHALIEKIPEAFVVTDGEGRIIEANRRFLDVAELPTLPSAAGHPLDEWLGRPGIDFGVLIASLKDTGSIRAFTTVLRGAYGAAETVEVSAAALFDHAEPRLGFLMRAASPRVADAAAPDGLPRSLEQMKLLVGNVPLKELVRETTDMIERLCIEAALEMTDDNRASAAEMLGLSRQSLYAKLHRFGLGDLAAERSASSQHDNT